jgi:spore cortex biosynthesis protein YabQ
MYGMAICHSVCVRGFTMELETFFSVDTQIEVFIISCLVGVVIGAVYDIFRLLRIVVPHGSILTAIEDILLISTYGIFLMCFAFSLMRGQIRFFFVVGNLLGFMLWFFTVGSIITKVANRIKHTILTVVQYINKLFKRVYTIFKSLKKKYKKSTKTLD